MKYIGCRFRFFRANDSAKKLGPDVVMHCDVEHSFRLFLTEHQPIAQELGHV